MDAQQLPAAAEVPRWKALTRRQAGHLRTLVETQPSDVRLNMHAAYKWGAFTSCSDVQPSCMQLATHTHIHKLKTSIMLPPDSEVLTTDWLAALALIPTQRPFRRTAGVGALPL
jgi:hypothetical protein